MATNCKHLQFWKIIIFLHFVIMAILTSTDAKKLRLLMTANKLANVYENYKKQVLSVDRSPKRNSRHIAFLNLTPSYKRHVYMFCKTGFLLQIHKSGRISGTSNTSSENALLEIQIFDKVIRRVKGVASGRYLSINNRGRLVSSHFARSGKNAAFFVENDEENGWYSYSSKHYSNHCSAGSFGRQANHSRRLSLKEWFIAIKENGSLRRPCKTHPGMSATHFCILSPENVPAVLDFSTD